MIAAAKEMKERLEALGLVTFCKTTGGKGLHVVTPLSAQGKDGLGWDEAKAFAEAVCSAMAPDSPDRYLLNMSKKLRTGRIFLDYLRNDRMSTAVAPLSPRMRPGAPVSMPLHWSQVRAGLDPQRFTMITAPALLVKSKPWADYCGAGRPSRLRSAGSLAPTRADERQATPSHGSNRDAPVTATAVDCSAEWACVRRKAPLPAADGLSLGLPYGQGNDFGLEASR